MRTATWADLAKFFSADGWREVRRTGDIRYEKVLETGDVLRSKRPSGKTDEAIGKDMFKAILRVQLRVSADEFWDCVARGEPVERPGSPPELPQTAIPLWLARRLHAEMGLLETEIAGMTEEHAQHLLDEFRSRPKP